MSGDDAYQRARSTLLSVAARGTNPGEAAVALVLGLHLVQDYPAHVGLTGMPGHIRRYGLGDANPDRLSGLVAGIAARRATGQFHDDFMKLLAANLGDEGAAHFLQAMRAAAGLASEGNVSTAIDRIFRRLIAEQERGIIELLRNSRAEKEAAYNCAVIGNPAACVEQ